MNESLMLARNITAINFEDIPSHVIAVTKKSILDTLGVNLAAGTLGEGCREFVNLAIAGGGEGESTIWGFGVKVPVYMAAFANGAMSHALDFEDAYEGVHPNAAAVPAAFAVAESLGGISGKNLITAIVLGCDLVCRLGVAQKKVSLLEYGWYGPPIMGSFGATAAACKLLNLDVQQVLDAFSLNLCQATCSAELIHSPHSLIRSIRDAFSAKSGVLSALLASRGIRGFDQPIEGKAGFFNLYARGNYDPALLTDGLGKSFKGGEVSFKPWPSCRGTHAYIDAALQILEEYNLRLDEIERINVTIAPRNRMLCEPLETKRGPKTAIDAKFSIPFVVATALVRKGVALEHFTPQALLEQDVLKIARKFEYKIDENLAPKKGVIEILTKTEVLSKQVDFPLGDPQKPINTERIIAKFKDCTSHSVKKIPEKELNKFIDLILNLENIENINELTAFL